MIGFIHPSLVFALVGGLAAMLPWLARYGYAGLAVAVFLESAGVPVPGETALLAAAFGAAHGALSLPWVIAAAALAGILGDNLGFAVGRRLGRDWLERHGPRFLLSPAHLARVDRFFERYGPAAVAFARFVAGVRVVAAFAAGTSRMRWRAFLLYNVLGAAAWATLVALGGYFMGRGYGAASAAFGRPGVVLGLVVPAALLTAWLLHRRIATHLLGEGQGSPVRRLRGFVSRWLVVLGTSASGVLVFAAIAEDVAEHETSRFDDALRAFVLAHRAPALDAVFVALTWAGSPVALGTVALLTVLALWRGRGARVAAAAAATPVLSLAAIETLKLLFHRARPIGSVHYPHRGTAFPAGTRRGRWR
ncbi:MAG TPA: VTT domain-containing protein [Gemmatimonadaceae bacterium]